MFQMSVCSAILLFLVLSTFFEKSYFFLFLFFSHYVQIIVVMKLYIAGSVEITEISRMRHLFYYICPHDFFQIVASMLISQPDSQGLRTFVLLYHIFFLFFNPTFSYGYAGQPEMMFFYYISKLAY